MIHGTKQADIKCIQTAGARSVLTEIYILNNVNLSRLLEYMHSSRVKTGATIRNSNHKSHTRKKRKERELHKRGRGSESVRFPQSVE